MPDDRIRHIHEDEIIDRLRWRGYWSQVGAVMLAIVEAQGWAYEALQTWYWTLEADAIVHFYINGIYVAMEQTFDA